VEDIDDGVADNDGFEDEEVGAIEKAEDEGGERDKLDLGKASVEESEIDGDAKDFGISFISSNFQASNRPSANPANKIWY